MTTQELKEYINSKLGNSLRTLLPSYWWKRLFGLVVDKVDEVEGRVLEVPELITSSLAEFAEKYPDIESRTFYLEGSTEKIEKNAALLRKVGEEYQNGIVQHVYLATLFNEETGKLIVTSPQFIVTSGFRFINVATPFFKVLKDVIINEDGTFALEDAKYSVAVDTSKFATTAQVQELNNILSDEINGLKDSKQDTLVSGTNIKTINGHSILGDGNIEINTSKSLVFDVDNIEPIYSIEGSKFFSLEQLESNIGSTIDEILEFSRNDMIDFRCDGMLFKSNCGSTYDENTDTIFLLYGTPGLENYYTLSIFKEPVEVDSGIYASATLSAVPLSQGEDTNLEGIIAGIEQQIKNKQDAIADLDTIRSGAALGATALQSYTEQYKGTVTGIKVNGSTHNPSNGVVDLGTISANESLRIHFEPNFDLEIGQHIDVTSLVQQSMGITPAELYEEVVTNGKKTALFIHELMGGELQEISRVIDSLYEGVGLSYLSTLDGLPSPFQLIISTTQCQLVIVDMLAGYNSVVVPLTEMVEGKQEQLVSGTNIKTINGESILGSGNITVSGNSSGSVTKADLVYAVSKSASQGRLTDPGYYYFNSPTTIDFGSVNQYPRGIYSIVIDGFSTEPLGVFYPLNFIWTNGEPDFASFAGTTKVLEISLFVLDDANSSKKVLATWALFNF